jgi:hypothetical protein
MKLWVMRRKMLPYMKVNSPGDGERVSSELGRSLRAVEFIPWVRTVLSKKYFLSLFSFQA